MNKTTSIVSGKKAYVAPVSYCLTVSGNIICTSTGGGHNGAAFGSELIELDDTTINP